MTVSESAGPTGSDTAYPWLVDVLSDLGVTATSPADDFFDLGGTSLTAIRLIARVEERWGEDALLPETLYEHRTLRDIAAAIGRRPDSA